MSPHSAYGRVSKTGRPTLAERRKRIARLEQDDGPDGPWMCYQCGYGETIDENGDVGGRRGHNRAVRIERGTRAHAAARVIILCDACRHASYRRVNHSVL